MNVPKLRFPEFSGEWEEKKIDAIFDEMKDKNHPSEEVLTIIQGIGTIPRKESGRNIIFDEKSLSSYKYVEKDNFIIHLRSFEGGLEIANSNGIVSPAYIIMKPKIPIASRFLYAYFRSYRFINHVLPVAVEGVRDGRQIKYPILKEEKIPFPSLPEQQKIADFLSIVDSIIASEIKILNALQKKKKALMQKLFSQQLRFKADDGSEFPEWVEKKLGDFCTTFSGGTPKSGTSEFYNGNIPFIRSGEIESDSTALFLSELGIKNSSAKIVYKGDLLYALYGANSGLCAISKIEGAINQAILCIQTKENNVFLCNYLKSQREYFYSTFLQGGQGNLSGKLVESYIIPLPCKEEQQKIADCLSSLDNLIQNQQKIVTNWQQRKKGLLQQMFI